MRIFGKLLGATLFAMAITLAVGSLGWFGLHTTRRALNTVIRVRTPQIQDIARMIENLNLLRADEVALVNPRLKPMRREQVVADLQQATQSLAAARRKFAALPATAAQARLWSNAQNALARWEPKHARMIALVADNRIVNVEILPGIISRYLLHYQQWFADLGRSVEDRRPFTGQLNPMASGLGHWLAAYQTEDPRLNGLLQALQQPHEALYDLANKINDLLLKGRFQQARVLLARQGPPALTDFRKAMSAIRSYAEERITRFDVAANYAFGDVARAFTACVLSLRKVSAAVSTQAISDSRAAAAIGKRNQSIALGATATGLLLAFGLGLLLTRHMVLRLRQTMGLLKELEQGHLDVRLSLAGNDEISEMSAAMDLFAEDLQRRVRGVKTAAQQLEEVSGQINTVTQQVNRAAQAQAQSVTATGDAVREIDLSVRAVGEGVATLSTASANSTSSALEMSANSEELAQSAESLARVADRVGSAIAEMTTSIGGVAANMAALKESSDATVASVNQMDDSLHQVEEAIGDTARVTEAVRRDAESGQASVEATSTGMQEIRQASRVSGDAITSLSAKVREIGKVLAMIDEVTDQTDLLALNATILAAQAGSHGQGFAVVAREIRELSERASDSTREIGAIIDAVQQETSRVAEAIARTELRVAEGEELSINSAAMLGKVVSGIQAVDRRMEQVARSTVEQTQGAGVIGRAMEQVADMVRQTAAATREQNGATETITQAVEKMRGLALRVQTSAREQSHGSSFIAAAMEEIDSMIRKINQACSEQIRERDRISAAVAEIRHGADANLAATALLQNAVTTQNYQIVVLRKQMGTFRVATADPKKTGPATTGSPLLRHGPPSGGLLAMKLLPAARGPRQDNAGQVSRKEKPSVS